MSNGRLKHKFQIGVYTPPVVEDPDPAKDYLLLESGEMLLLESGAAIELENN